jgi:hypothetical protein
MFITLQEYCHLVRTRHQDVLLIEVVRPELILRVVS